MPTPRSRRTLRAWHAFSRSARRHTALSAGVLVIAVVLSPAAYAEPTTAAPSTSGSPTSPASPPSSSAAPTIDASVPTPTTPPATVTQGFGPGGVTIGGPQLDTRSLDLYDGAPPLPAGLSAHGLVVADLGTGQVLAAVDPHGRYYPASTLKTLTFISLYGRLDPNQVLNATLADVTVEGSRVGIVENGQYTVGQLWTALMLQSGNDAASMLTAAAGGNATALAVMNEKAKQLQAFDTLAGTTSGLDIAGQSSSPYDLCLFMREIVQHPELRAITGQVLASLPAQPPRYPQPMNFGNQNQLMLSYPGAIGGKTGFTDAARHTFVAAAERNGRTLVVSLMQAEHTPLTTWQQATALLDWGFAAPADAHGAGRLVTPDEVSAPPVATSGAASSTPSTSDSPSARASAAPASAAQRTTWPLLPILGVLLAAAIGIAAPRVRQRHRAKHY